MGTSAGTTPPLFAAPRIVGVAYSLQSRDHARIRAIAELIRPGAVFADDGERYAPALDSVAAVPAIVASGR
jgi:feruloyl-CoA synthase